MATEGKVQTIRAAGGLADMHLQALSTQGFQALVPHQDIFDVQGQSLQAAICFSLDTGLGCIAG